jgi:prepilin-type N-terminal cleavage/methylation domain-containing protein
MTRKNSNKNSGFTLIEIAIVMVVIGLLTGGGISIMRVMTERKVRNENSEYLQQAKEAILSFAEINGRLPWPDTDNNGTGTDNPCALNSTCTGFLPFADLNIAPNDAYQRAVKYEINNNPGSLGAVRGTTCGSLRAWPPPLGRRPQLIDIGAPAPFTVAAVLVSGGPMDADGAGGAFDATAGGNNITGNPGYIRSTPTTAFDDVVVFIGGFELNSKMACTVADVHSSTGIDVRNTGVTILSYRLNGGACTNWNPNTSIIPPVIPTDLYEIFSNSGCGTPYSPACFITYSQLIGVDVDRDGLVGFSNGLTIDR